MENEKVEKKPRERLLRIGTMLAVPLLSSSSVVEDTMWIGDYASYGCEPEVFANDYLKPPSGTVAVALCRRG